MSDHAFSDLIIRLLLHPLSSSWGPLVTAVVQGPILFQGPHQQQQDALTRTSVWEIRCDRPATWPCRTHMEPRSNSQLKPEHLHQAAVLPGHTCSDLPQTYHAQEDELRLSCHCPATLVRSAVWPLMRGMA